MSIKSVYAGVTKLLYPELRGLTWNGAALDVQPGNCSLTIVFKQFTEILKPGSILPHPGHKSHPGSWKWVRLFPEVTKYVVGELT
jgi:hypothetical protein